MYQVIKRVIDIFVSFLLLLLLSPLFLFLILLLLIVQGRPLFYSQERVGRKGRHFTIYKFRSMIVNAETLQKKGASEYSVSTPLGRRLRLVHIDEIPQLWNILKGDMAFIGPRPIPEDLHAVRKKRNKKLDFLRLRPGLTGFHSALSYMDREREKKILKKLSVQGNAGKRVLRDNQEINTSFESYYEKKESFLFDVRILWWTFLAEIDSLKSIIQGKLKRK